MENERNTWNCFFFVNENGWKRMDYLEPYSGLNTETIENGQKRLKTDSGIGENSLEN